MYIMSIKLCNTKLSEIPIIMSKCLINIINKIIGNKLLSLRSFSITVVTSILLTIVALLICAIVIDIEPPLTTNKILEIFILIVNHKAFHLGLPANVIFDVLTVFITLHIIKLIYRSNVLHNLVYIIIDIIIAIILAIGCYITTGLTWDIINNNVQSLSNYIGLAYESIYLSVKFIFIGKNIVNETFNSWNGRLPTIEGGMYSITTLLPTLLF